MAEPEQQPDPPGGPLVDACVVQKPAPFAGPDEAWPDWKFSFLNYMQCVRARYYDEVQLAAAHAGPANDGSNAETKQRSAVLYAALASLLRGRSLGIIKG
eukprot:12251479-Alexandrium_andersonii.AAC.1